MSSKIQFSPPLTGSFLVTNQIIYTHGEHGHTNVKVIKNSQQLLKEIREKQKLKLLRSEYIAERGKMQFILERVLILVAKFFYNVGSGIYELSIPSRLPQ